MKSRLKIRIEPYFYFVIHTALSLVYRRDCAHSPCGQQTIDMPLRFDDDSSWQPESIKAVAPFGRDSRRGLIVVLAK